MSKIMFMVGETSGDTLAVELLDALRAEGQEVEAFGAGGPKMKKAGIDLKIDLSEHAVIGIWEAVRNYRKFKGFFDQLLGLALKKKPEAIICIDNPGFNLRFVKAIGKATAGTDWNPKIIYYISPQLWAWHSSRVRQISEDVDLLLSIFPFEKEWYAKRAPGFPVEFVGHPLCDRYPDLEFRDPKSIHEPRRLLLLPGSRTKELSRHLPVMVQAAKSIKAEPLIVLPNESMAAQARLLIPEVADWDIQIGHLEGAAGRADVAIASSGTVTLECAWFRVPTVVLYRTSWITYLLGKLFIKVKHIAMPNVLAEREVFPELIQSAASPGNLAREVNRFLDDSSRRVELREELDVIADSLGGKGAALRAARCVIRILKN
ncbi:MAG: lipid-A-disaccharide synthase [Verrucomicrobiota bacterium]|nr:lipid-A-disaccharide synthase [Verrucomicrobiota bacterium]